VIDGNPDTMLEEFKVYASKATIFCQRLLEVLFSTPSPSLISHFYHDRINVKLGGINTIPDPSSVAVLTDPNYPTIVMGTYPVCPILILRHQGLTACSLQVLTLSILHPVPMVDPLSLRWSATLTQTLRNTLQVGSLQLYRTQIPKLV